MKTKLGGFSATRIKSNKTHHRNDDGDARVDVEDYYTVAVDRRASQNPNNIRATSSSTRSTTTNTNSSSSYTYQQYQQQDSSNNRDIFTSMPAYSGRGGGSHDTNDLTTTSTGVYLHRQVTGSGGVAAVTASGGGRRDSNALVKSASSYHEIETHNSRQQVKRFVEYFLYFRLWGKF